MRSSFISGMTSRTGVRSPTGDGVARGVTVADSTGVEVGSAVGVTKGVGVIVGGSTGVGDGVSVGVIGAGVIIMVVGVYASGEKIIGDGLVRSAPAVVSLHALKIRQPVSTISSIRIVLTSVLSGYPSLAYHKFPSR